MRGALRHLKDWGVRYVTLSGGEPTLHPDLPEIIQAADELGLRATLVSNGATLTQPRLERLMRAGLGTLILSVDSGDLRVHAEHRGLPRLDQRLRPVVQAARARRLRCMASVTVSRLSEDLDALGGTLRDLGFDAVTFSYPKRWLGSSSRVFSADSPTLDLEGEALASLLGRLKSVRRYLPVLNPDAAIDDVIRHVLGDRQVIACVGGHRYLYMDTRFQVYRCDHVSTPMGPVEGLRSVAPIRDGCVACTSACYRDASAYMQLPIALGDALGRLRGSAPSETRAAPRTGLRALAAQAGLIGRLARL